MPVTADQRAMNGGLSLEILGDVEVIVSARIGDARLPLAKAADISVGSIVRLECAADAPVDLLVNGVAVASGELVLDDLGVLSVEVLEVGR